MLIRKLVVILLITYFHKNIKNSFLEDISKFDVDKFDIKQMQEQTYRCIRYFENSRKDSSVISSYHEKKCANYRYEYLNFILWKEKVCFDNFIKKIGLFASICAIIYLT